ESRRSVLGRCREPSGTSIEFGDADAPSNLRCTSVPLGSRHLPRTGLTPSARRAIIVHPARFLPPTRTHAPMTRFLLSLAVLGASSLPTASAGAAPVVLPAQPAAPAGAQEKV